MKYFLLCLLTCALMACGYSADETNVEGTVGVPAEVVYNFNQLYPGATDIEWEREGNTYEAEFTFKGNSLEVEFDEKGNPITD